MIAWLYFGFVLLMLLQGLITLHYNLYIWEDEDRMKRARSPLKFAEPTLTFSIIMPAYREEAVIARTIARVAEQHYPSDRYEIIFVCRPDDLATFNAAHQSMVKHKIKNGKILRVDLDHDPVNKPYKLNQALNLAKYDYLVIFDSEDIVHRDILNVANTTLLGDKDLDVLQCGVQLMNYQSNWFSSHNVLEYYFWFKSRMHAHMAAGTVPLGGNTVFFRTKKVRQLGGWNERCLAEDAEIGMRLSVAGSKMKAVYDYRHVTKEETPHSVEQFVKQRTRWAQGFLQIIRLGHWRKLPNRRQRILALYILAFPAFQALLLIISPLTLVVGLGVDLPFIISLFSFLPVTLVFLFLVMQMTGLFLFVREQRLKFHPVPFIMMPITFIPYQLLLAAGAGRAVWREMRGRNNWEKTAHTGAHMVSVKEASHV